MTTLRKCLVEVELYVEDDGTIPYNENVDLINDIPKYVQEKDIKYIGAEAKEKKE